MLPNLEPSHGENGFCNSGSSASPYRIVTTSWDDGDPADLRIAELLRDRKLAGTFYVPIAGHHGNRALGHSEILELQSGRFEIGAHGTSHLTLSDCDREELVHEVEYCKGYLENLLGSSVRMFAYPKGRYSGAAIEAVKRARYVGARTTRMLAWNLSFDPFRMPTTVHVYPHSPSEYLRNSARAADFAGAWRYVTRLRQAETWVELSKRLFDLVLECGGVWHLYGHSWEVDELGLWKELEEILNYVRAREGVAYVSNGGALDLLHSVKNGISWKRACLAEK